MVSVSFAVRKLIEQKPLVYECLIEGIASHAALAEYLLPQLEQIVGENIQLPAIVMAIRRYAQSLETHKKIPTHFKFNSEIIMKTNLADITIQKTPSAMHLIRTLYNMVDYDKGDTLNIITGNYEITVVISQKYLNQLQLQLQHEKVLHIENELVSLSISFSDDFLHTPGILAQATRALTWDNINIYENISTMTELIFIIKKHDATKAYTALQTLIDKQ